MVSKQIPKLYVFAGEHRADAKAWSARQKFSRRNLCHAESSDTPRVLTSRNRYTSGIHSQPSLHSLQRDLIAAPDPWLGRRHVSRAEGEAVESRTDNAGNVASRILSGGTIIFGVTDQFRIEGLVNLGIRTRRAGPAVPRRDRAAGNATMDRHDRIRQWQAAWSSSTLSRETGHTERATAVLYRSGAEKKGSRTRAAFDVGLVLELRPLGYEKSLCSTAEKATLRRPTMVVRLRAFEGGQSEHQSLSNHRISRRT